MVVDLNNSSISSLENVATEITSAWKYTNFVDGIKRGCSGWNEEYKDAIRMGHTSSDRHSFEPNRRR